VSELDFGEREGYLRARCAVAPAADADSRFETMMSIDLLTSATDRIDDLLHRIAADLQLRPTEYELAEQRYTTIATLLSRDGSPLAYLGPTIYAQGSLRIGTSVRPFHRTEFDVDLVVEFDAARRNGFTPRAILDAFETFLRSFDRYDGMVERMSRCIRLNYAGEFHMDILPAFASRNEGSSCIEIPDEELRCWLKSNPKGFAEWFERKALIGTTRSFKSVEELPDAEDVDRKPALKRAVQMLKRARDIAFGTLELRDAVPPASIVLTTLAAHYYNGTGSVARAMEVILDGMMRDIAQTNGTLVVNNPVIEEEEFSEVWSEDARSYRAFVQWIVALRSEWRTVLEPGAGGFEIVAAKLKNLFGEVISERAIVEQTRYIDARGIRSKVGVVGLTTSTTTSSRPIVNNTFFGS
jgi:hypothetical protein